MNRFSISRSPADGGEVLNFPKTTSQSSGSGEPLLRAKFPDRESGSHPGRASSFFLHHRPSNPSPHFPCLQPPTCYVHPTIRHVDGLGSCSAAASGLGAWGVGAHCCVPFSGLPLLFSYFSLGFLLHDVQGLEPSFVRTVSSGGLGRLSLLSQPRLPLFFASSSLALPFRFWTLRKLVRVPLLSLRGVRRPHVLSSLAWGAAGLPETFLWRVTR
jgi:hypothetical protein